MSLEPGGMHTDRVQSTLKVKLKFTLEEATKAQSGSKGTALLFP
jgi:hypothetical protein